MQKKLIYIYFVKKKLIACEIGPNYQIDDGLIAFKLFILLPVFYLLKNINKNSFDSTSAYFNRGAYFRYVDSGRTGLTLLLKSLDLEHGSEVLLQGFSCVVVPNSVLQANLVPVLCDINEFNYNIDLDLLESKVTKKTRVLIVQYAFGVVPDMEKVIDFCKKHNIFLIEDCAHVFNQKINIHGELKEVGSIGYGSALSFGRDKVISSTVGGAVVLNHQEQKYKNNLQIEYDKLPSMKQYKVYQSLLYCILTVFLIRPFYHYGVGKVVLFLSRKIHLIGDIYSTEEKKGTSYTNESSKYSDLLEILLKNQLKKLKKYQSHRQKLSKIYISELGLPSNSYNYLRFPLTVPKNNYNNIKKTLRTQHVLIGTWYNSLFIPAEAELDKFNYHLGDLPVCEKLINNRVLNLPTNINTSEDDAMKIAETIKPFLV
jgi:perosamine synthetase